MNKFKRGSSRKADKLRTYMDKILRHLKGDVEDLLSVFEMLDDGAEVQFGVCNDDRSL